MRSGRLLYSSAGLLRRTDDGYELVVMVRRTGLLFRIAEVFADLILNVANVGVLDRFEYITVPVQAQQARELVEEIDGPPERRVWS